MFKWGSSASFWLRGRLGFCRVLNSAGFCVPFPRLSSYSILIFRTMEQRPFLKLGASAVTNNLAGAPFACWRGQKRGLQHSLYRISSRALLPSSSRNRTRRFCSPIQCSLGQSAQPPSQPREEIPPLKGLVAWALSNGIDGVGTSASKIALFEGAGGERGLLCAIPILPGEVVMRIPLKLALTDHPEDEESNALCYEGAPWSVRLACKLLRLKSEGYSCPWYPYIRALPRFVPGVLQTFAWDDMKEIEYSDLMDKLHFDNWLISDAFQRLDLEAHAGASREEFEWAVSIVHSRCFGSAGKEGKIGVHMLVPVADMMNHAGDQATGLMSGECQGMDYVQWDLSKPERSPSQQWELVVYAHKNIVPGEEITFSYGERTNDDFFLHYGFVPPGNPRDEVVIFKNLGDAIDWYCKQYINEEEVGEINVLKADAMQAGLSQEDMSPDLIRATKSSESMAEELSKLKIMAGSLVDGRVLAAFDDLEKTSGVPEKSAIAERCWQMLSEMKPLSEDLEVMSETDEEHNFKNLCQFYKAAMGKYTEAGGVLPVEYDAERIGKLSSEGMSFPQKIARVFRVYKKMILWDVLLGVGQK